MREHFQFRIKARLEGIRRVGVGEREGRGRKSHFPMQPHSAAPLAFRDSVLTCLSPIVVSVVPSSAVRDALGLASKSMSILAGRTIHDDWGDGASRWDVQMGGCGSPSPIPEGDCPSPCRAHPTWRESDRPFARTDRLDRTRRPPPTARPPPPAPSRGRRAPPAPSIYCMPLYDSAEVKLIATQKNVRQKYSCGNIKNLISISKIRPIKLLIPELLILPPTSRLAGNFFGGTIN